MRARSRRSILRQAQLCEATGVPTFHLETAVELTTQMTAGKQTAGVTAGASTPEWIVQEFVKTLESI